MTLGIFFTFGSSEQSSCGTAKNSPQDCFLNAATVLKEIIKFILLISSEVSTSEFFCADFGSSRQSLCGAAKKDNCIFAIINPKVSYGFGDLFVCSGLHFCLNIKTIFDIISLVRKRWRLFRLPCERGCIPMAEITYLFVLAIVFVAFNEVIKNIKK